MIRCCYNLLNVGRSCLLLSNGEDVAHQHTQDLSCYNSTCVNILFDIYQVEKDKKHIDQSFHLLSCFHEKDIGNRKGFLKILQVFDNFKYGNMSNLNKIIYINMNDSLCYGNMVLITSLHIKMFICVGSVFLFNKTGCSSCLYDSYKSKQTLITRF